MKHFKWSPGPAGALQKFFSQSHHCACTLDDDMSPLQLLYQTFEYAHKTMLHKTRFW